MKTCEIQSRSTEWFFLNNSEMKTQRRDLKIKENSLKLSSILTVIRWSDERLMRIFQTLFFDNQHFDNQHFD